jgi:hypothetical protein
MRCFSLIDALSVRIHRPGYRAPVWTQVNRAVQLTLQRLPKATFLGHVIRGHGHVDIRLGSVAAGLHQ